MRYNLFKVGIVAVCVNWAAIAGAADVRINGFVSVVGGTTLSEGKTASGGKATFAANSPTAGVYDDDISFKPDTLFGLQVSSNLGDGLSVTGQITGAGGEDFDANVAWAYITYELNDSWSLMAGRQRIPFFANSDYLDVGYAYHWMRPPTVTDVAVDDFEGVSFRHTGFMGDWDTVAQVYMGENTANTAALGPIGLEDILGGLYTISSENLKLRATYMVGDIYVDALAPFGQGDETPVGVSFFGVSGRWTIGNSFVEAEYVGYDFEDPIFVTGWSQFRGWYTSFGHRMGEWTPHITYTSGEQELISMTKGSPNGGIDGSSDTSSVILGVRWDFHPQAAFKVEYETVSDDSTANKIAIFGYENEVDLFSVGIDVIF